MEALGRVVEAFIGKARQATVQVSTRGGVQPILSIESQLSHRRIMDIIEAATHRVLGGHIPNLKGLAALEVGEGPISYLNRMLANQAEIAIGVEIGGGSVGGQGDISRGFVIRAGVTKLPFPREHFSYILARMATQSAGDVGRVLRELGRVLTPGGHGVVVDYHPFGLFAKRGAARIRPPDSGVHRFGDYYRICRQVGLRVVDVREDYIDEGIRKIFKGDEIQAYRNLKGTPLLIFLFVYKPKLLKASKVESQQGLNL